jgi:sirohydrochlorin ferrochelatase
MTVILAAHGAGDGSEANRSVLELTDALRWRRPHVRFECAFWKGTPSFQDAAGAFRGQAPVVVPIMASDGYYARQRLPEELTKGDPSRSFVITRPIGTLPAFSHVLASRVREAVGGITQRGVNPTVLLVGHGTPRLRSSGDAARRLREELACTFPQTEVLAAFLDESPYVSDVADSLRDRPVVAAPLLMGGGPHVLVDLGRALTTPRTSPGLDAMTETLRILPPILAWPELAPLTLEAIDSTSLIPASLGPNPRAWHEPVSTSLPLRVGSSTVP